jgi:phosphoglycolate phosphatase
MYKLIIFDFDGTLADTFFWFATNVNKAAEKFNFKKVNLEEMKELRHLSASEMLKKHHVPIWKLPIIAAYMRKLMQQEIDELTLFNTVPEMLETLQKNHMILALVTSNSQQNVSAVLGNSVLSLFNYLEFGVSIFGKKTKIKKVIKNSKIPLHQIIYIGDEIRDAEAARALGIHFGAVSWGYNDENALIAQSPNIVFRRISDIKSLLL